MIRVRVTTRALLLCRSPASSSSPATNNYVQVLATKRNFASSSSPPPPPSSSSSSSLDERASNSLGFDIQFEKASTTASGRSSSNNSSEPSQKQLAVICGWMGAQPRQLKPYADFYKERGYDVLSYACSPQHVLQPKTSMDLMERVLEETLRPTTRANDDSTVNSNSIVAPPTKIVTHCFSVGGYLTGQMLRILSDPSRSEDKAKFHQLVKAQIYDSPPDFNGIAKGIGKSMEMGDLVADQVERVVNFYLWAVKDYAGKDHRASSAHFHDNHLPAPSLWMYSQTDPVACPDKIRQVMDKWATKGRTVEEVVWEDTPHVQHARIDPKRYFDGLDRFLGKHAT